MLFGIVFLLPPDVAWSAPKVRSADPQPRYGKTLMDEQFVEMLSKILRPSAVVVTVAQRSENLKHADVWSHEKHVEFSESKVRSDVSQA